MAESTLYISILIATIAQSTLLVGVLLTNKKSNKAASYFLSAIIEYPMVNSQFISVYVFSHIIFYDSVSLI